MRDIPKSAQAEIDEFIGDVQDAIEETNLNALEIAGLLNGFVNDLVESEDQPEEETKKDE